MTDPPDMTALAARTAAGLPKDFAELPTWGATEASAESTGDIAATAVGLGDKTASGTFTVAAGNDASRAERIETGDDVLRRVGADAVFALGEPAALRWLAAGGGGEAVDRLAAGRDRVEGADFPAAGPESADDTEVSPVSAAATPATGTQPIPRATIPAPTPSHR